MLTKDVFEISRAETGVFGIADAALLRDETLHGLFEFHARHSANRIAIEQGSKRLRYAEAEARANQVAHFLVSRGLRPGDKAAILLPRAPELYVALLAVLKTGAAYVPLDPAYPADRVDFILKDCGARLLITQSHLAKHHSQPRRDAIELDTESLDIARQPTGSLTRAEAVLPDAACYVIYTSGSTGRPKGVEITHRSACHLVRAQMRVYRMRRSDRVYQGFSVAFDASVEEIWTTWAAGATLVASTPEMAQAGPALSGLLAEAGITVFSCVPTLLSMLDGDIPSLRLLILGGEACPQDLVKRWFRSDRRMINTYGPTEATVIATWSECRPDRNVTIGKPIPNYSVFLLDEELLPVKPGEAGEICIGGPGLARGYVNRPDLTRKSFVTVDPSGLGGEGLRLYRSGDLGRLTEDGDIEFLGRADTQVKIRGFRVELSEIETVMLQAEGVRSAAVALREDVPGLSRLAGYVVPRGGPFDLDALKKFLQARLPHYMVPSVIVTLPALPTLTSGKVDRKSLPAPREEVALRPQASDQDAGSPLERKLLAIWAELFSPLPVALDANFFLDLGGHSLLAARMVSEARRDAALAELSVAELYRHPTVASLAAAHALRVPAAQEAAPEPETAAAEARDGDRRYRLGAALQGLGVYGLLGLFSAEWMAPYLAYSHWVGAGFSIARSVAISLGILLASFPAMLLIGLAAKWLIIGRFKAGRYPLWGAYFLRWWLVQKILALVPIHFFSGTPLLNLYCRLLGAKIGRDVFLGGDDMDVFDLIRIGDGACIAPDAYLMGSRIVGRYLEIGPISIGRRCSVATSCQLNPFTALEDDAHLEALSMLPSGGVVPAGETWSGSPARPQPHPPGPARESVAASGLRKGLLAGAQGACAILLPAFVFAAYLPAVALMNDLDHRQRGMWYLLATPLFALSFVILLAGLILAAKWLLLGRIRPGRHSLYGFAYFRKWFFDQLMELSLGLLGPMYGSVYLPGWLRLLGAKLGKGAEVSTASSISPDLLALEDGCFVADAVSLGVPAYRNGCVTLAPTRIGARAFIGNSAVIPAGASVGTSALVGVLSVPPRENASAVPDHTTWLGSPAILLPERQVNRNFSDQETFHPSPAQIAHRAAVELARIVLPPTSMLILTSLILFLASWCHRHFSPVALMAVFPLLYAACGGLALLFIVALKWILVGRYAACEKPLWSPFVWTSELITSMHDNFAVPFMVGLFTGTPLINWYFRLLGASIGKQVYLESIEMTEFDLIRIGDCASINSDATLQTHLFEDRVMKISGVEIGAGCTVGGNAVVLYDTRMEAGAGLGGLSLLMKGETLPAGTAWEGIPARRAVGAKPRAIREA